MKTLFFIALGIITVYGGARALSLGSKRCTWGPSYWCTNLTTAAGCRAVPHCIDTVWEKSHFQEDKDSICETCISMVKQARDQLESNETQEDIKQVFEGSCKLIPIKIVAKECCKLADDFIPELVETLASQMNPQVVCSVAGLCNNAKIDKLLLEHSNALTQKPKVGSDTCAGCHKVVDLMEQKFNALSKDDFLQKLLHVCGKFGSFSDACSNIVITYFSEIYKQMKDNFNSNNICLMSGECSANFHTHKVEITPMSDVGVVEVNNDLPCDLCKQLVGHLRELLIADTTKEEFKKVLKGLCDQTNKFKDQCNSIVNEYYTVIYDFLVSELNSTALCEMIGICTNGFEAIESAPIIPLLPVETVQKVSGISNQNKQLEFQSPDLMQLPIERMYSPGFSKVYNKQACTFCQYFLHYVQQAITDPKTDEKIKEVVGKVCHKIPDSLEKTCVQFVDNYGDAVIALLAQEIDPSTICPLLQICPAAETKDIEIFMQEGPDDKCPLCIFAVSKLEEMVKDRKTKSNIKTALKSLCSHFSGKIAEECDDFVTTYTDELVEMLVDDFKPQEVCVYLKLCKDEKPAPKIEDLTIGGVIHTNEIPDYTANGVLIQPTTPQPQCILCEFVMERLEKSLQNKETVEEIKHAIENVCNSMPKSIRPQCNSFVDEYAILVLDLIVANVKPHQICEAMALCPKVTVNTEIEDKAKSGPLCPICKVVIKQIEILLPVNVTKDDVKNAIETVCSVLPKSQEQDCKHFIEKNGDIIYNLLIEATSPSMICSVLLICEDKKPEAVKYEINKCAVCEGVVVAVERLLANPKVDHSIEHVLEKACRALPKKNQEKCRSLIEEYGNTIFQLVTHLADSHTVCKEIGVCANVARPLLGADKCVRGPKVLCSSAARAKSCGVYDMCLKNVWNGVPPV